MKFLLFLSLLTLGLASQAKLKGTVKIDGSSTVFPITEAVAEEFGKIHPRVRVAVGVSGTGGGFKKFATGKIDINDASRRIKEKEIAKAKANKVEYLELPVAFDGISVVVNKANTWAKDLTVAELKKIWQPGSKIKNWKQIRSGFPDMPLKLYGPSTDSGTFDYFTKAINGKERACRNDFTKSEDDNVLVKGVAGEKGALGFFGFAYYKANASKINALAIKTSKTSKAIKPTFHTINDGTYKPLSRPVFIYVSKKSGRREVVNKFVTFYLNKAESLVKDTGYVPLTKKDYAKALKKFDTFVK